jgi:uncharacterized membrane protein YfcA
LFFSYFNVYGNVAATSSDIQQSLKRSKDDPGSRGSAGGAAGGVLGIRLGVRLAARKRALFRVFSAIVITVGLYVIGAAILS